MDLKTYCKGYLRISLKTSSLDRFLNMCKHHGFTLWKLEEKEEVYELCMMACDFKKLTGICKKSHSQIHITKKKGLPFLWSSIKKRRTFVFGMILCAILVLFLSQFVWNIKVSGNQYYDSQILLRYLYSNKIQSGILKKNCSCSEISESLRAAFPNIVWVSTKMTGSCLEIQIKENLLLDSTSEDKKSQESSTEGWALQSDCDGTIVSIITQRGIPIYKIGDSCKKGDTLVSGWIPLVDDNLEVLDYTPVKAQADILVKTFYSYYDEFPLQYQKKNYKKVKNSYQLSIGNFVIGATKFLPGNNYDLFCEQQQILSLYEFPFTLTLYRFRQFYFTLTEETYTSKEAKQIAAIHLEQYLSEKEKLGVQILENSVKIRLRDKKCMVSGKIWVQKETGILYPEKKDEITQRKEVYE